VAIRWARLGFASTSSPTGTGTLAYAVGESKTGLNGIGCCAIGVWGDTNQTTPGAAGLASTADDAQALFLGNNSVNYLTANINNYENTTHNVNILGINGSKTTAATGSLMAAPRSPSSRWSCS